VIIDHGVLWRTFWQKNKLIKIYIIIGLVEPLLIIIGITDLSSNLEFIRIIGIMSLTTVGVLQLLHLIRNCFANKIHDDCYIKIQNSYATNGSDKKYIIMSPMSGNIIIKFLSYKIISNYYNWDFDN
jgi:hypothetical protein